MQVPAQNAQAAFATAVRELLRAGQREKAFALESDLAAYYATGKPTLVQLAKKYGVATQASSAH